MSIVSWDDGKPRFKAPRGTYRLEREAEQARVKADGDRIAKAVKVRDKQCRWPEAHKCRGGLESAHIDDKGMGGDHGLLTHTGNLLTLCSWIHRRGPESLHGKQLKVECETEAGADGHLSFWRADGGVDALGQPTYTMVARETPRGIERD